MGIRFFCPHCDHRLHVKEFLAGRKGICPHCDQGIRIPPHSTTDSSSGQDSEEESDSVEAPTATRAVAPGEAVVTHEATSPREATSSREATLPRDGAHREGSSTTPSRSRSARPSDDKRPARSGTGRRQEERRQGSSDHDDIVEDDIVEIATSDDDQLDPIEAAPHLVWYVRPPAGGQYGPAEGSIMRRWVREGRVTEDSLVWQEGWEQWRPAREVFSLGSSSAPPPPVPPVEAPGQTTARSPESRKPEHEPAPGADEQVRIGEARERMLDYRLSRSRSRGRQWAAIIVLGLLCVGLIVLLGLVVAGML
ncbi:MAG: DUF4339 domain-containing protein [Pirellulaceae bacterium]